MNNHFHRGNSVITTIKAVFWALPGMEERILKSELRRSVTLINSTAPPSIYLKHYPA